MGRKFYRVKKNWVGNFIGLKKINQKFYRVKKNCVGNFIGSKKIGSEILSGLTKFVKAKTSFIGLPRSKLKYPKGA